MKAANDNNVKADTQNKGTHEFEVINPQIPRNRTLIKHDIHQSE